MKPFKLKKKFLPATFLTPTQVLISFVSLSNFCQNKSLMFGVLNAGAAATFQVHNSKVSGSVVLAVAQAATSIDTAVQPATVVVLGVSSGTFYLDVSNGGG